MGRIGEIEWNCRTGALSEEIVSVRIRSEATEEVRRALGDWAMREKFPVEGGKMPVPFLRLFSPSSSITSWPWHRALRLSQRLLPPASSELSLSSLRKTLVGTMGPGGTVPQLWGMWHYPCGSCPKQILLTSLGWMDGWKVTTHWGLALLCFWEAKGRFKHKQIITKSALKTQARSLGKLC